MEGLGLHVKFQEVDFRSPGLHGKLIEVDGCSSCHTESRQKLTGGLPATRIVDRRPPAQVY